ncbi:MAG: hypothetical protein GXO91_03820 [FCB group bacterium]|nr:hypothetical protein [FCB group bacterium]
MSRILLIIITLGGTVFSQNFNYDEGDWWVLISPGAINAITETYDELYFAADNGIFTYDKTDATLRFDSYLSDQLQEDKIQHLFYDYNTDILWAVTDRGIFLRASNESYWRRGLYDPAVWEVDAIGSSDNYIWINSNGYLIALDAVTGAKIDSAEHPDAAFIKWDASRFNQKKQALDFYNFVIEEGDEPVTGTQRPLLNYRVLPTVKFIDSRENIYFGTDAGEVYYASYASRRLTKIAMGVAQQNITDIYKDEANNWWFSDSPFKREGTIFPVSKVFLTRWRELEDSWVYYYLNEDTDIKDTNINCMLRYRDTLFLGTLSGLLILDINRREWTFLKNDLNDPAIWDLAVFGDNLYVATALGVNEISLAYPTVIPDTEHLFKKFKNVQIYTLKTFDGYLYVGSEIGLYRLNAADNKWQTLSTRQMRYVTVNDSLIFASDGYLWEVEPDSGESIVYADEVFNYDNFGPYLWINESEQVVLMKYDTAFKRVYNKFDGIPGSKIFTVGCDDQWVWFGTDGGVAFFKWSKYYQVDK